MIPRFIAILIVVVIGAAIFAGTFFAVFNWTKHETNAEEEYRGPTSKFKFVAKVAQVAPQSDHPLSRNGPYIDTHFKDMNAENPIGQTYYQRPITSYDSKNKVLMIHLHKSQPTIHMNSNTVTRDVTYGGLIKITDFTYGKYNPNSKIFVNVSLDNMTGRELVGFHVHDGELSNVKKAMGFTMFGPIAYFIHTTPYWVENATKLSREGKFPLPLSDATSKTEFPFLV
jgi:hypothetical protein